MKTKVILALVVAGALGFTSCTKKIDEKTLGEITQFGTDWTALGEKATAWSTELSATATQTKEFATQQADRATALATSKDQALKTKADEMSKMATDDVSKLEAMVTEYGTFKATFDETTKQYSEWKDKITKGEISTEEAIKGLADFKTKMSDAQAKIETWNTAYAETKSSCEKNMAAADEMAKSMEPTSAKK
jgi:chromosome segregation ATPase